MCMDKIRSIIIDNVNRIFILKLGILINILMYFIKIIIYY